MDTQTENLKSGYIPWVDIFKGICIILTVMGHAGAPFTTYIYLFHMPAFIFISGFTYSGEKYTFIEYLKKKVLTLLLPMIVINIFYIIFYVLMQKIGIYGYFQAGDPISFRERIWMLFSWLGTTDFGGATWFLFVLFTIEVLFKILSDVCMKIKKNNLNIIIAIVFSAIGWYYISGSKTLPYYLDLSLFGMCFFGIGVLLGKTKDIDEHINKKVMTVISLLTVIFYGSFYFSGQLPMNWPTRQFASLPMQLLSSFCTIYLCYIFSKILGYSYIIKKMLIYIGKRTYCILVFHFVAFRLIFGVLITVKVFPLDYLRELTPRYSSSIQWLVVTVISIGICLFVSMIAQKNRILSFIINAKIK